MDVIQYRSFIYKALEKKKKEHAIFKLQVAEAVNYSYIGSQPPPKKNSVNRGAQSYGKWRDRQMKILFPDMKEETVWDRIKKSKKSMVLN